MLTVATARSSCDDNAIRGTSGFVGGVMFSPNWPHGACRRHGMGAIAAVQQQIVMINFRLIR